MPSSLPVPSKGALRTLRNLALGTSCTVSFTAGLLTEDRRRRIHAAREVHDNAQKLKSSRSYHSAGTSPTTADTFENQIREYQEDGLLLPWRKQSDRSEKVAPREFAWKPAIEDVQPGAISRVQGVVNQHPAEGSKVAASNAASKGKVHWRLQPRRVSSKSPSGYNPNWCSARPQTTFTSASELFQGTAATCTQKPNEEPNGQLSIRRKGRQMRLASDVQSLLNGATEVANADAAAARFLDAFDDGFEIGYSGISSSLMNAAIDLSTACLRHSRFQASEKVLLVILDCGPIDETFYNLLSPMKVVENLLQGPLNDQQSIQVEPENLVKAAKIFLAEFKERPRDLSEHGMALGVELCSQTYRAGMTKTTVQVYGRLQAVRGSSSGHIPALKYNILAEHQNGQHKYVVEHFSRWFKHTMPSKSEFFSVCDVALDSALIQGRFDRAEKVMAVALEIATAHGLTLSTTWLLRLLGSFWRSSKDLESTRALFQRQEACLKLVHHPVAVYSAMIQFCVESGDESTARAYQAQFERIYGSREIDIRTCGHFALAKALRKDWRGVEADFEFMSAYVTEETLTIYSKIFVPIFMEFIKTHSLNEIEEFLKLFTQRYKVPLHVFMSNAMLDAYAQARELRSMLRWLQHAATTLPALDAVAFNIILTNCYKTWGFKFHELYHLCHSVQGMVGHNGRVLIDSMTISILKNVAMKEYKRKRDSDHLSRAFDLLRKIPAPAATTEYSVDSHEIGRRMHLALSKGDPTAALQIYDQALRHHVHLHASVVATATKASLQLHGRDFTPTAKLLAEARENRYDITIGLGSVFVYEMTQRTSQPGLEADDIAFIIKSMDPALKAQQHILPAAVTHAASILVFHSMYQEALNLWSTITFQQSISHSAIDIVTLTVLVRAYVGLRDSSGITWAIKILQANNLAPDTLFLTYLNNARRANLCYIEQNSIYLEGHELTRRQDFQDALEKACDIILDIREDARQLRQNVRLETVKIMQEALVNQKENIEPDVGDLMVNREKAQDPGAAYGFKESWEDEVEITWPQAAAAEGG